MNAYKKLLVLFLIFFGVNAYANRDFLVNLDWVSDHIDDGNLVILETRYYPHRYHTIGHIPGAVQVKRFTDLGNNTATPIMRFPTKEAFEKTLRSYGVNNDSTVVLYDDSGSALSSRVYFLLDLYGFNMQHVKIMNGGIKEWTSFEETTKEVPAKKYGNVTLKNADKNKFVEWNGIYDDVLSNRDSKIVLLDARPHKMYTGKKIKGAINAGHIPGAVNIVSMDGIDAQYWVKEEQLKKLYASIPKSKTIYVYCHDGFRMSLAYVQLTSLGYKNVKLYNGGWADWGNKLSLPTVMGDKPYAGDYNL